jgi:quinol---cytochrome c reductase iron-sulfur subunit, bacillus type
MPEDVAPDRRCFVKTMGLLGATTILAGVPTVAYVVAPALQRGGDKWIELADVSNLEPGQVKMLVYELVVKDGWKTLPMRDFVWVKAKDGGELTVFSYTCPHLGCNVVWRDDCDGFECPCHSARFDGDGRPLSGPPSRPLTVLAHRVEDGKLHVRRRV